MMCANRIFRRSNRSCHALLCLALFAIAFCANVAIGAPYGPDGKEALYRQPDGSTVKVRVFGDEFYAVAETEEGYTVAYDNEKVLRFGQLSADGENILPSNMRATNKPDHAKLLSMGIKKGIRENAQGRKKAVAKGLARMRADRKGRITPQSVQYYENIKEQRESEASFAPSLEEEPPPPPPSYAPPSEARIGQYVGICILVDFPDQPGTIPQSEVDDYCNKPGYSGYSNGGSVYDYFFTQSNGRLRYNNIVTAYVRLSQPKTYYDDGLPKIWGSSKAQELVAEALDILIAQGFDFTQLSTDSSGTIYSLNIFYAGTVASSSPNGLWPHKWAIPTKTVDAANGIKAYTYQMTDISNSLELGTFCHENGHMLMGYPDYYDYDYDSRGMGSYTLMAYYGNGLNPHNIHGYLKYHSGWVDAIELYGQPTQLCSVRVDSDTIYKYTNPSDPQEYFTIENRSKYGWEAGGSLPDQGLFIVHADENGGRDNQQMTEALHYECSVEQADGNFNLESHNNTGDSSDLFHSGGTGPKTTFDDTTTPNAKWWAGADGTAASGAASGLMIHSISVVGETMTFIYGAGTPAGDPVIGLDANTIDVMTDQGQNAVSETFSVFNAGGGTLSYTISDNQDWLSCTTNSGTATTGSDTITINFSTSGLSAGSYSATITVEDASVPTSDTITVNLTVNPQPVLGLSLANISENAFSGSAGPQVALEIINTGGGTLNYALSKTQSWLSLTPASGTVLAETDTVYIDLDASALAPGTYNDTITITSAEASNSPQTIPVQLVVADGPVAGVSPTNLALLAVTGTTDSAYIVLTNSGGSALSFTISDDLPSATDYVATDSDAAGGPTYSWIDISGMGTVTNLLDDGVSTMISIGFGFPFYGSTYNQFQIGANGVVSLTAGPVGFTHGALPSTAIPSQSFVLFWDDLDPSNAGSGDILYHSNASRLVVSFLSVPEYGGSNPQTFQLVLYPDGRIVYQYQTVNAATGCTVGLQDNNSAGPATQLAYNSSYLKNAFAIEFTPPEPKWLSYPVSSGSVAQDTSTSVWFHAFASNLAEGVYTAMVSIAMNDINYSRADIPLVFTVVTDIGVMAPSDLSATAVATNQINLSWTDNSTNETGFVVERSESSGSGFVTLATTVADVTSYADTGLPMGMTYYYRVYATNSTDTSAMTTEASATTLKFAAMVSLSNLSQPYNGTARVVGTTTDPLGLTVDVTYNGNPWAPTNAGTYAVEATINEPEYEGSTNGTLEITQAATTVNGWPSAAPIVDGDALSSATLTGGDASQPGTFSYDSPLTVPPVGVYLADVTFVPSNANFQIVSGGTVSVDVAPAAPSGLAGSASVGQVDLTWDVSSGALSYSVKRATLSGGDYTTLGSAGGVAYSDMTVTNGETYYYVVSAVGTGGEGPNSTVASVTLPNVVPFVEDFEALSPGDLAGQRLWEGSNAVVQAGVGVSGSQGLNLGTGTAQQTFANGTNTVTVNVYCKPVPGEEPAAVAPDAASVFWVDTNLNVRVYSNTTAVTLSAQIDTNTWTHFEIGIDYAAGTWQLSVDGGAVISGLGLYSARTNFTTIRFENTTDKPFYIDDISIASAAAAPTAYETWLADYGFTTEDDSLLSSNGVNTIREAYIAGIDPTNAASVFAVTSIGNESGAVITWGVVSGRLYNVYWSSNLLGGAAGFQLLQSNIPWTVNSITDTVHSAEDTGFYRIDVQLE